LHEQKRLIDASKKYSKQKATIFSSSTVLNDPPVHQLRWSLCQFEIQKFAKRCIAYVEHSCRTCIPYKLQKAKCRIMQKAVIDDESNEQFLVQWIHIRSSYGL
jgi:hypothetical protein